MKNLFKFIFVLFAIGLVSCQSDDNILSTADETENVREDPSLRAAYHYFDMQAYGYGREICYNLMTYSHTYDQFTADFDVEWYVGEDFNWLSTAFNSIENYPRMNESGHLYSIAQQGNDYYTWRYGGYSAEYSIRTIEKGKVRISMDKVPATPSNMMSHYKIPVRTKFIPKDGGAPIVYDLIWDCKIWGGTDFILTRTVIRSW